MEKLIVGNFKNYMTSTDVATYLKQIDLINGENIILCPSNIYIPYFLKRNFKVGIQNICNDGTYTGEISVKQAKSMGIFSSIIGHSERRINFNETNEIVNSKIKEALKENLNVILCIGETIDEKDNAIEVLEKQIIECLKDIELNNIVIAYEPVWAIGTGIIPTVDEIEFITNEIKKIVNETFDADVKVLYGGSVNGNNISDIIKVVDGVLIGKASTDMVEFLKIIEVVNS